MAYRFAGWALTAVLAAGGASAASWPERPVRLIADKSAGSSLDTITRIFVPRLSELLGQQIVIDNRGGAGGIIGIELAARANPDGYTLLVGAPSSMILSRFTYDKLAFDTAKPDGAPRKGLDSSVLCAMGWRPRTTFRSAIEATYSWFLENVDARAVV